MIGLSVSTAATPGADPVAAARRAEDLGFDFVSASDHLHGGQPTYETWTMLSWIAAATSRIRVYLADLKLSQRAWACPKCGGLVDRNANAAANLRDWTGPVTDRDVQRGGVAAPVPRVGDHDGQAHVVRRGRARPHKTTLVAGADDTRTEPGREPRRGRGTPSRGANQRTVTDAH